MRKAYSQATFNRVQIKGNKVQIGWVSTTSPGLSPIFCELPENILSQFKENSVLLMESIKREYLPGYAKKATWNLLHAYIDAHIQIFVDGYPGDKVQDISRFQYQCPNITFSDQIRYNRMFQKVIQKSGDSAINHIKIFQNSNAMEISVVKSYYEDQLMYTFLENFQQGVK